MELWHYTCPDHGLVGIQAAGGLLRPNRHPLLPELGAVVWATEDGELDDPRAIGFTAGETAWNVLDRWTLSCDRSAIRYQVPTHRAVWWPLVRRRCDPMVVADLESYGRPDTWWVLREAVVALGPPWGRTGPGRAAVEATSRLHDLEERHEAG